MTDLISIGNCSGFYGDRLSAARELIEGGKIDVLTGDYLAELTMTILHEQQQSRGEHLGYVGTFLKQFRDIAALCSQQDIKVVCNAGGLNPQAMAAEVEKILAELGINLKVAWIDGDDIKHQIDDLRARGEKLAHLDKGEPLTAPSEDVLTANIYLGAWGIKTALDAGADVVICPRVTDAALVIGPAAWKFNWARDNFDALAGALTAGHIIECGAQCCGGNYAFFDEIPSLQNIGYPIAHIAADGSFTVTKNPGTGGLISRGTVTAQLLYEIRSAAYLNPDVIAHFDTLSIVETGPDRVHISGCRGSSPPDTHKVCLNLQGPQKQTVEALLTGLDIDAKARLYADQLIANLGGPEHFDDIDIQLIRSDKDEPATNEEAQATLRLTFTAHDNPQLGRLLKAKVTELVLASIPGITNQTSGQYQGERVAIYWPTSISSQRVTERVHFEGGCTEVPVTQQLGLPGISYPITPSKSAAAPTFDTISGETVAMPLGRLFGTRSGDKGGAANCGVWARTDRAYDFLIGYLTVARFKQLLPDLAPFTVERYALPNLRALNFYINDMLGDGVSSSHRIDRQAKSLGEYLRVKNFDCPIALAEENQVIFNRDVSPE